MIMKPPTWTTELTQWDINLLEIHPYGVMIPNKSLQYFYHITEQYLPENFQNYSYTWKGPYFFFTNEEDAVMFTLRWC